MQSTLAQSREQSSDTTTAAGNWWQEAWNKAGSTLSQVVVVRRLDEKVKPLLSPEQSAYARLNLQLQLEEAELAVLQGHQELYSRSLEKARTAINDWYDSSNPQIMALADTLEELAGENIDPELPDISQSLQLLKARLAGRLEKGEEDSGDDT
jgi:uroporphyrin-3 C-methyltransferase